MSAADVGGADAADAAQKRVRALQKKLRQIQQLKEKRDNEGDKHGSKGLASATTRTSWHAGCMHALTAAAGLWCSLWRSLSSTQDMSLCSTSRRCHG